MGILSRISKVLESNVNSLLERAEDPAKMLEQAIDDMKKGQREARQAIIEAKTQKRLVERKRDKAQADANGYERRAMQALKNDDEETARRAVELKLAAEQRVAADTQAAEEQARQIKELEQAERQLERRLAELPAKRAALMARQSAAQAKGAKVGAANRAQNSVASALNAFDRMEERVIRAEVEAEVIQEGDPERLLLAGEPLDTATEDALAELKARVTKELAASTEAPANEAEAAEESAGGAVDDTLAELKAKLAES